MKANSNRYLTSYIKCCALFLLISSLFATGCGGAVAESNLSSVDITVSDTKGRSNDIHVLTPEATGRNVIGNDTISIDYSNASEGYIVIRYFGSSSKVKFQLTGPNQVTYTYNLQPELETVVPLSSDSGTYLIAAYENISDDQYATCYTDELDISISNTLGPFLYPNQYVNFSADTKAVIKASDVVKDATCDLEAVAMIYDFVATNVVYDKEEAENVETSYLPDVDEVLSSGKGICFDYAALMAAMLRSQGIPTRLEIGYAKDAYHAWISVYTKDQGWIGGIIQFDGAKWALMDPTLAANSKNSSKIKEFIGDGSSYTTKYMY